MDLIVQFGRLVTCRPAGQIISHEVLVLMLCFPWPEACNCRSDFCWLHLFVDGNVAVLQAGQKACSRQVRGPARACPAWPRSPHM